MKVSESLIGAGLSVVTLDSQQVPQVRHWLTRGQDNCKLPD